MDHRESCLGIREERYAHARNENLQPPDRIWISTPWWVVGSESPASFLVDLQTGVWITGTSNSPPLHWTFVSPFSTMVDA
jgi:hypothetical protein